MDNEETGQPGQNQRPHDLSNGADRPVGSVRWRMLALMLIVGAVSYLDRASISLAMPLLNEEFTLSPAEQGILLSAFFWAYAFFQVPGGWLADRFGPRRTLSVCMALWAVCQAAVTLVRGPVGLIFGRAALGVAEAPQFPTGGKLNALWLTEKERSQGGVLVNSAASLGSAVGALIVGWLIAVTGGWRLAFLATALVTLAAAAFVYWYARDHPRQHPRITDAEVAYIERQHAVEDSAASDDWTADGAQRGQLRILSYLRFRSFWATAVGWMTCNVVFFGVLTFGPLYLSVERDLDIQTTGTATFLIFGAGFVGENFAGWLGKVWRRRGGSANLVNKVIIGTSAAIATLAVTFVPLVDTAAAAVTLLTVGMFFLRFEGMYWALPATLAGRQHAGVVGGMMNTAGAAGGILSPLVMGFVIEGTGSYFAGLMFFSSCGLVYLIATLLIDWGRRLPIR